MKALFILLISTFSLATSFASNIDNITIAPNGKTSTIEVRVKATKASDATITITNAAGVVISTQNAKLVNGANAIALVDVANIEEGTYVVTMVANGETSYSCSFT
jgi:hypothetical protein